MTVYHFNTFLHGGAAIAAQRLFDSLPVHEKMFINGDISLPPHYFKWVTGHPLNDSIFERITFELKRRKNNKRRNRYFKNMPDFVDYFSIPERSASTIWRDIPDIMHLHWIADFLDYPSFFNNLPLNLPIVWTLHDMAPFTGGCHYSWECQKFMRACDNCPQLNPDSDRALARKNQLLKESSLAGKNLHVVADSFWIEEMARNSSIFKNAKSFQTIHYGIDCELFIPIEKEYCKRLLRIPDGNFVICFGADSLNVPRKGLNILLEAISKLSPKGIKATLLVFGQGDKISSEFPVINVGKLNSAIIQSLIYSAGDIFVIPSVYEAFGQTALEAMACGTPVVGFNTGGVPDMVKPYKTGLLADMNSDNLMEKICWMINNEEKRKEMGQNSRNYVLECFSLNRQAARYMDLYKMLLSEK